MNDNESKIVRSVNTDLFINGKWRPSSSGRRFSVEDPASHEIIAEVADAGERDATEALDAAVGAQRSWAKMPARQRGEILRRAFEETMRRQEDLATLMTMEMGKPLSESKGEVAYAAEFLRWFSEEAVRISGDYYQGPEGTMRILTMRQPVGPSFLITPWNFPLAMATRKIGPALAAGCTVVVKPAELTPLTMLAFVKILEECGLPEGVVNLVATTAPGPLSDVIISDSRLRKLSFTGSTEVGRMLMAKASENLLRLSMELGGNAPLMVFDDADLEKAVNGAFLAKMRNMGEACTSANRIFVQRGVADRFSEALAEKFSSLKMGRGMDPESQVGPLIEQAAVDKVQELLKDATDRGARVVVGGSAVTPGYFFEPTVVTGVGLDYRIAQEEIFGPIAPIYTFDSEEEMVTMANSTEYGLVAYVFTESLHRALRVVEELDTGMVGVNQGMVSNAAGPFGGVKHSGFGREGGFEGIDEYLYTKYAAINHQ